MNLWNRLEAHRQRLSLTSIADSFASDPRRAERFSLSAGGLLLDYSKTLIDGEALASLLSLAAARGVERQRDFMLAGGKINTTEDRSALHTALRRPRSDPLHVDGADVTAEVHGILERMRRFSDSVRRGGIRGAGGKFTDVVNIGIGGSDLGPEMACQALWPYRDGPAAHFISNVDGAQAAECLSKLNPATTLVIVASKTFTTVETLTNASAVRAWMRQGAGVETPERQFAAVSADVQKCVEFGLDPEQVFAFKDWVGGRYSIWGPVGLPLMIRIGSDRFQQFLDGGCSMDRHFAAAPPDSNLPVLHALIGIWHNQVCGHAARAILPYDHRLRRLPAYLQQLIMESNGKSVTRNGEYLEHSSAAVIWGEPGTNGQHAFFQALHQGTQVIPCEFLVAAAGHEPAFSYHHDLLVANCLAQSEALMTGKSGGENGPEGIGAHPGGAGRISAHRRCPGNRPSTTLIYPRLTPFALGQIIALYEHSVFVEGSILGINSFDQWGVELGKEMANTLTPQVSEGEKPGSGNGSTSMLLNFVHAVRQKL